MIDLSILDDATIWVAISFLLFVILIFKPVKSQISDNLNKKIDDLKNKIDEAQKLKIEAEKLHKEQEENLKINLEKIEQLKLDIQTAETRFEQYIEELGNEAIKK